MKQAGRGFTLVELVIALTLMAALAGSVFYSFGTGLRAWRKIAGSAQKLQIENITAERLGREIRSGSILSGSTSQEIFIKVGPDVVSYRLVENKIRRKKNGGSAYLTSDGEIARLSFDYPAAGLAEVSIGRFVYLAGGRNN
ncbi:MAG: type II secretion system protein [Candidatus Margulisbacteria bacterium]|nr:type II secretion system protein [Candidatus Margulisiibacteriota bacterium]